MIKTEHHNRSFITECIQAYLKHLKALKYKPKSIRAWRDRLNRFLRFAELNGLENLQDITLADLEKYRLELVEAQMTSSSIYIYLSYIKRFFEYLEDTQRIFINPASNLILPKCKRKLQAVPNEKDVEKLLAQPDISTEDGIRDRAIIEVFYSTGLRLEELTSLQVFDPDLKNRIIRVIGKGSKERIVPLGKQAVFWLRQYIAKVRPKLLKGKLDEHALWIGSQWSRKLHPIIIQRNIREYGKTARASVRITPHALRRACATHMLRAGAHPVQIQFLLGHTSLRTLSQYLKVTVKDMKNMHKKSKPGR